MSGLDLSGETPSVAPIVLQTKLDPRHILLFAKQILLGCAIVAGIFALAALILPPLLLAKDADPDISKYVLGAGTSIIGVVTSILPPIVALVLGFYFGKKDS